MTFLNDHELHEYNFRKFMEIRDATRAMEDLQREFANIYARRLERLAIQQQYDINGYFAQFSGEDDAPTPDEPTYDIWWS